MRLVVLILSALLVAAPAAARDPAVKDGRFTICVFQDFEKCELLTKRTMRLHGVTEHDTQVLKQLKRHAEARHTSVAALEQSFGKASKVFPHSRPRDSTIAWFQDSVGMNDLKAKCPEIGRAHV